MHIQIKLFGIARDIVGGPDLKLEMEAGSTVKQLLERLQKDYPDFTRLRSLLVAVNSDYAQAEDLLRAEDEIALIPPVSGG